MKLKQIILNIVVGLSLTLVPAILPASTVYAAPACGDKDTAKQEVLQGVGLTGNDCKDNQVDQVFKTIVQLFSIIIGAVSVIVIMYAGFRYITSGGEQARVAAAKSTLLYALVGLAVAALAQLLIHFVLFQANRIS